jgi:hypothetical protein
MALVVEDGTGKIDSESYISVADATTYHAARANSDWLLITDKEAALRKATDYMIQVYRSLWQGYRAVTDQALDWPRLSVYHNEYLEEIQIASNIIPIEVKNACAELALKTYTDEVLLTDEEQKVTMEMIGPITIKYSDNSTTATKKYSSINAMLKPFLKSSGSQVIR